MRRNEVLLRLAREIEVFHFHTEQGRVTVLPVIVDELIDTRNMLGCLANSRMVGYFFGTTTTFRLQYHKQLKR